MAGEVTRPSGSLPRLQVPGVAVAAAALVLALFYAGLAWQNHYGLFGLLAPAANIMETQIGGDSRYFWAAGHLAATGQAAAAYDPSIFAHDTMQLHLLRHPSQSSGFLYPPAMLPLLHPFGLLDFAAAWPVFIGAGLLVAVSATLFVFRAQPLAFLLLLGFGGLWKAHYHGQFSLILLGLYLLVLLAPQRPLSAGVALAVAAVKPHIGFLMGLLLLCRRQFRVLAIALAGLVVLVAASLLLYGPGVWEAYAARLLAPAQRLAQLERGQMVQMASFYAGFLLLGCAPAIALLLHGLLALLALRLLHGVLRRKPDFALAVAATLTANLLVTPHLYIYDLVLLALPLLVLFPRIQRRGWCWRDAEIFLPAYLAPYWGDYLNFATHLPFLPLVVLSLLYGLYREASQESGVNH